MFPDVREALRVLAETAPRSVLYSFLKDGEDEVESLTRFEADRLARIVAAQLVGRNLRGKRVLIALPPGLDYVASMLGCVYAGAIAIPALPPTRDSESQRLGRIIADCDPNAAIVDTKLSAAAPVL